MKNLRIYASPNKYKLKVNIENYDDVINYDFNITLTVNKCSEDQLAMVKNDIEYCETPICTDSCPVDSKAICYPYTNNIVSDNVAQLNICKCKAGWEDDYCGSCCKEIFIDLRYLIINICYLFLNIYYIYIYIYIYIYNSWENSF